MSVDPRVSVIIPTYNRAHLIQRALCSVFRQTFTDYDVWIVDDGSSDQTEKVVMDIVEEKQPLQKVHYLFQKNKGVSTARNQGIRHSKGEWIALLDSDDEWLPDRLEKQLELAYKNPHLPLIHGEEIWIRRGKRVNPKKKHQKSGGWILKKCLPLCLISPSASLLKRSLLEEIGLFREDYPVCEDYDLWLRATSLYPVGFVETPLIVKYGGHEDQLSQRFKAMDYWRVKSLAWILLHRKLSSTEVLKVKEELGFKCKVLLSGYNKHRNLTHLEEVESLYLSLASL